MRTKLHKTVFACTLVFAGIQVSTAQDYLGEAYNGTPAQIGTAIGAKDKVQLEDYDAVLGNNTGDGWNYGAEPVNGELGTYWDKSPGNSGDAVYRTGGDIDLAVGVDGDDVANIFWTGTQGGEFTFHTVNVITSGNYHLNLHYKSFGANKKFQVFLHPTNSPGAPSAVLFNAAGAMTPDGQLGSTNDPSDGGFIFRDSQDSQPFVLTAGTWLIRARTLDGGPNFDYVSFTLDSTLSVDDAQFKANNLKAYPNPAINGHFNLNIDSKWNVYSILGVKVLEGEGKNIDLSTFAKGAYILRTPYTTKMLVSK